MTASTRRRDEKVAMHEAIPGPSGPGSVVLELGRDVGALVLEAPAALLGREIEISPAGGAVAAGRTHSLVRERRTAAGTSYAAVYPGLAGGRYVIWRPGHTSVGEVTIDGGRVACFRWPG
jgi:hypothetical protein